MQTMVQSIGFLPMAEADIPAMIQIGKINWPQDKIVQENLPKELADALVPSWRQQKFWVARVGGVIGFCGLGQSGINYNIWDFTWANVLPAYRGQGIGRMMVEVRLSWIKAAGGKLVLLTTTVPNVYEKFGFKVLSTHKLWGGDTALMALEI